MDDLLDVLLCKTETYFQVIKNLQSAGRMPNSAAMKLEETLKKATGMMEKGWPNLITRESSELYIYKVPSEQDSSFSYRTCPAECFCSCPVGVRGQVCKHLVLLDLVKDKDNDAFPELALQLEAHARALQDKAHFNVCCDEKMEIRVESLCGRGTYHVSLKTFSCTCCTFSYQDICPCLLLAQQLFGVTNNEKKCCSVNQTDTGDLDLMLQDSSSDFQKLQDVLEMVKRWQTVPDHIKLQINDLYVNVHKEDRSLLLKRHYTNDTSKKIRPLFPRSAKHWKKTEKNSASKKICISDTNSEEFKRRIKTRKGRKSKKHK